MPGPAVATEVEVASLLLTASASVLALTGTTLEVIAVVGGFVWVVALMVLLAVDVARAARASASTSGISGWREASKRVRS